MSIKVMTRVWESSQTAGSQLILLLAIADNANDYGIAWPGVEHLSKKIRMSAQSVMRLTVEIETCYPYELNVHRDRGRGRVNRYCVTTGLTDDERAEAIDRFIEWCGKGNKIIRFTPAEKGNKSAAKGNTNPVKGNKTGLKGNIALLYEPSIEPPIEPSRESLSPDGESAGAAPDQPQPKPLNPRQQAIKELEEAFRDLSTLPLPLRNNEKQKRGAAQRWWNPLAEIWEMCDKDTAQACLLMTGAYNAMIQSNLTVSAPASVLEKAKAIKALQTRGMGDQNGNPIISNPGLLALRQVEARARP
jgi:hypothetical protein